MSGAGTPTTHDPLWDTRRRRLDISLAFTGVYLLLGFLIKEPAMLSAMVAYSGPAFGFAGLILGAYFGIAEWGRTKGVLGATVETTKVERSDDGTLKQSKTTTAVSAPMPEGVRPPRDDQSVQGVKGDTGQKGDTGARGETGLKGDAGEHG